MCACFASLLSPDDLQHWLGHLMQVPKETWGSSAGHRMPLVNCVHLQTGNLPEVVRLPNYTTRPT